MGRRKIEIQPIRDERNRAVTFFKRKAGLFKKAYELAVLCQVDLALIVMAPEGRVFEYSTGANAQEVVTKCHNMGPSEMQKPPTFTSSIKSSHQHQYSKDEDASDDGSDSSTDIRTSISAARNARLSRDPLTGSKLASGMKESQADTPQAASTIVPPSSTSSSSSTKPRLKVQIPVLDPVSANQGALPHHSHLAAPKVDINASEHADDVSHRAVGGHVRSRSGASVADNATGDDPNGGPSSGESGPMVAGPSGLVPVGVAGTAAQSTMGAAIHGSELQSPPSIASSSQNPQQIAQGQQQHPYSVQAPYQGAPATGPYFAQQVAFQYPQQRFNQRGNYANSPGGFMQPFTPVGYQNYYNQGSMPKGYGYPSQASFVSPTGQTVASQTPAFTVQTGHASGGSGEGSNSSSGANSNPGSSDPVPTAPATGANQAPDPHSESSQHQQSQTLPHAQQQPTNTLAVPNNPWGTPNTAAAAAAAAAIVGTNAPTGSALNGNRWSGYSQSPLTYFMPSTDPNGPQRNEPGPMTAALSTRYVNEMLTSPSNYFSMEWNAWDPQTTTTPGGTPTRVALAAAQSQSGHAAADESERKRRKT